MSFIREDNFGDIKALMNTLPGMVYQCILDNHDYSYKFVSEGCLELTGYTSEELAAGVVTFFDMVYPEDASALRTQIEVTIGAGKPFEGTYRIITKEGIVKWIWERSWIVAYNADGSPHLIEGFDTDISKQMLLETAEKERELLRSVNMAAIHLLSVDENEGMKDPITTSMEIVGRAVGADRVHIWRNVLLEDDLHFIHEYTWLSENGKRKRHIPLGLMFSYKETFSWHIRFARNEYISGPMSKLHPEDRDFLINYEMKSIIIIPLFFGEKFWGFFSIDDCSFEREFSEDEINILQSVSLMMSSVINRHSLITKLHEANERVSLMLDASPLCTQIWDRNLNTIDCNEAGVRLYGFKDKQDYVERFLECCSPEYQPDGRRSDEKAMQLVNKAFMDGYCVFDWMHQMPDTGAPIPAEITLVRAKYYNDDVVIGHTRDLREHNKMMQAIETRDHLLRAVNAAAGSLLNSDSDNLNKALKYSMNMIAQAVAVDYIYLWKNKKTDGKLYCNKIFEWSFNRTMFNDGKFFEYGEIFPGWKEILASGEYINSRVKDMSLRDKERLRLKGVLSILVVPIFIHDRFWGFVGFEDCHKERLFSLEEESILQSASLMIANSYIRDEMLQNIKDTSNKLEVALVEANDASKAKGDFLAKMSHEVRTPMNAIIGMTELALREDMSSVARDHVMTVKQSGINLLAIINDILDFSKIESGNMQLMECEYMLPSLINDVISIIRMRAVDSQVRFVVNIDSNLPANLIGDETRMRQVLINVLGNAMKYTDKGHVAFRTYAESIEEGGINLVFEVEDSGRGIKSEDIENLFHNYFQIDTQSNSERDGVGLGLAITWNIVNSMDGSITVDSEYGRGSTFTIKIPQKYNNPEKLAVIDNEIDTAIIYERRELYAASLTDTIKNLGVKCLCVSTYRCLEKTLSKVPCSFVFISYALFKKHRAEISELCKNTQIVLIAEYGESIPVGSWAALSMPAYAIPVANVFNGVSDRFSYNVSDDFTVRFIAPSAKILVVDDINTNLKVVKGLLLPYKADVDLRSSGAEAITAVQSKQYDLVFMDHKMPDMDGVETTTNIRALGGKFKTLPIVALTANAVSGMKEMFLEKGFDDFLSKPIDTVTLNSILEKWIPKHKRTDFVGIKEINNKENSLELTSFSVEGLDIEKGLRLTGGTAAFYLETLETFYEDGKERVKEIGRCLEENNFNLYVTHVHALKGASANIGADKLSEAAGNLEMAGLRRDTAYLDVNNSDFIMALEHLLDNINGALTARADYHKIDSVYETEILRPEMGKLKEALSRMDARETNRALEVLVNLVCEDSVKADIRKISKHILMFEYDEAEALIDGVLG